MWNVLGVFIYLSLSFAKAHCPEGEVVHLTLRTIPIRETARIAPVVEVGVVQEDNLDGPYKKENKKHAAKSSSADGEVSVQGFHNSDIAVLLFLRATDEAASLGRLAGEIAELSTISTLRHPLLLSYLYRKT
jgi:hypothetical protein